MERLGEAGGGGHGTDERHARGLGDAVKGFGPPLILIKSEMRDFFAVIGQKAVTLKIKGVK